MGKVHRFKPARADAEMAVRTLIAWAGDNPDREGLQETPVRVTRAYEEWSVDTIRIQNGSSGFLSVKSLDMARWSLCATSILNSFAHTIWLRSPGLFTSGSCPMDLVGISKLARVVDAFAKRLQIQECLTAEIADVVNEVLEPQGVGVVVKATHGCLTRAASTSTA